jgi:hypothetical protein
MTAVGVVAEAASSAWQVLAGWERTPYEEARDRILIVVERSCGV